MDPCSDCGTPRCAYCPVIKVRVKKPYGFEDFFASGDEDGRSWSPYGGAHDMVIFSIRELYNVRPASTFLQDNSGSYRASNTLLVSKSNGTKT